MAKANPYDPSNVSHVIDYTVKTTGDRWFIPVNAPTATTSEQLAQCAKTSPDGVEVVAT